MSQHVHYTAFPCCSQISASVFIQLHNSKHLPNWTDILCRTVDNRSYQSTELRQADTDGHGVRQLC